MKILSILFSTLTYSFAHKLESNLETIYPQDRLEENLKSVERIPFETRAVKRFETPKDEGGNYGDYIYRFRVFGDRLLLRDIVLIDLPSSFDQDETWKESFPGKEITHVRVLNFGRLRAFCTDVTVTKSDVKVTLRIPLNVHPRLIIEVYGE